MEIAAFKAEPLLGQGCSEKNKHANHYIIGPWI